MGKRPTQAKPTYQTQPTDAPLWVSEPFRVFFPLGVLASVLGVMAWPLFYAKVWPYAPHFQHPRLMIFGFGFAFVVGFLGTAWPRFLESKALRLPELALLVLTWLTAQVLFLCNLLEAGDRAFLVHVLVLIVVLALRLGPGKRVPPGFALAFLAVLLGFGAVAVRTLAPASLSPWAYGFTKLLIYQGLLLLPLLGVGSYLFARFFQVPGQRPPTVAAKRRMAGVWLAAALVIISFGMEASGWIRGGNLLRAAAIVAWAGLALPALWQGKAPSTRAWALRIAIGGIFLSFLLRGIWHAPPYAFPHLLFLGGFGLAILLVADRVTVGHSDGLTAAPPKSKLWRWLVWLVVIAAATRVTADLRPSIQVSHQIYAAILWAIIALIWAGAHMRRWWFMKPADD